jgi:hypothetical protein
MTSITLSVPAEVKEKMDSFPEINWSGFVRQSIVKKTEELSWKEEMFKRLEKEKDFDEWAVELSRKSKRGRFKRLLSQLPLEEKRKLLAKMK